MVAQPGILLKTWNTFEHSLVAMHVQYWIRTTEYGNPLNMHFLLNEDANTEHPAFRAALLHTGGW